MHSAVELILKGKQPELQPLIPPYLGQEKYEKMHTQLPAYFEAMRQAKEEYGIDGRLFECRFTIPGQYSGQLDMAGYFLGEHCFWDWKTGSTYAEMTVLQLAAYADLAGRGEPEDPKAEGLEWLRELSNIRQLRRGLQIKPDGTYKLHEHTKLMESYDSKEWDERWQAVLFIFFNLPDHTYTASVNGEDRLCSKIKDIDWTRQAVKKLREPVKTEVIRCATELFSLRRRYNLL